MEFNELTDSFVITKKFASKDSFCIHLHNIVKEKKISYMESVLSFCEESEVDVESVSQLLDENIKQRIREEAEKENLIKPVSNRII